MSSSLFSLLFFLFIKQVIFELFSIKNAFFKKNLSIYFRLCRVFVAARGLSLVAASRGYPPLGAHRLLTAAPSRCRAQAPGTRASVAVARRL